MSKTIDTAARLAEAERQFTLAEQAHAAAVAAHASATTATIRAARDAVDDALGALNEARLELEQARTAHSAAEKASKLSRFTACEQGAAETRKLLEREFAEIGKLRDKLAEASAKVALVLTSHAANVEQATALGHELGETVTARPLDRGVVQALALSIMSRSERASFDTGQLTYWLATAPAADLDVAICHAANPGLPRPPNMSAAEASAIYLRELDPHAPHRIASERDVAAWGVVQARAERERELLQRSGLTTTEQLALPEMPGETLEEKIAAFKQRKEEIQRTGTLSPMWGAA